MIRLPDGESNSSDIIAEFLQGDILTAYMLIICLDSVLRNDNRSNKVKRFHI